MKISICTVSYNTLFYNRLRVEKIREFTRLVDYEILVYDNGSTDGSVEWLRKQDDVILYEGKDNSKRHGAALDYLVKKSTSDVICALDADAFPVSPEWIKPALYLDNDIYLAGIRRGWGNLRGDYVCPTYLFGWRDWLSKHSFKDNWPSWDTAEKLTFDCKQEGHQVKLWQYNSVDFDGRFKAKSCDYDGLVWHTWWSTRKKIGVGVGEFEGGYHDYVQNMLREKYNLEY
jgi:glycosyltransferase involved in cell wall biosynthesis